MNKINIMLQLGESVDIPPDVMELVLVEKLFV